MYGDNGVFTVEVCVADDDTETCATDEVAVDNVNPEVTIDESGTTPINGTPTLLGQIGQPLNVPVNATDPGGDDLTFRWDWGDGQPDDLQTSLVNPPIPDPLLSPSIQPRDVVLDATHAYLDACLYELVTTVTDDDGGVGNDAVDVIMVGSADANGSAGYWRHQARQVGRVHIAADTLQCYLDIVGFVSTVFHEENDAATLELAEAVLDPKGNAGDMDRLFDRQLLAAWLNFASGASGSASSSTPTATAAPSPPSAMRSSQRRWSGWTPRRAGPNWRSRSRSCKRSTWQADRGRRGPAPFRPGGPLIDVRARDRDPFRRCRTSSSRRRRSRHRRSRRAPCTGAPR